MPTYTFVGHKRPEDRLIDRIKIGEDSQHNAIWLNLGASANIDADIAAQLGRRFVLMLGSGIPVIPTPEVVGAPRVTGYGKIGDLIVSQGDHSPAVWKDPLLAAPLSGQSLGRASRDVSYAAPNAGANDVPNLQTTEVLIPASGLIEVKAGCVYAALGTIGAGQIVIYEAPVVNGVVGAFGGAAVSTFWFRADTANQGSQSPHWSEPLVRTPGNKYVYKMSVATLSGTGVVSLTASSSGKIWIDVVAR